ncbi:tryptophan--tRNA ligase [candidate division WWE3 bacterium RIFCSPLOWO2_12_FULL_36_10]|uniref:Tryptophan--tRNA ligase n=1 Tax=candidate division WWE3 bacterium RIFCSPLOWO2_12_FULL_36_10 TaxID=1802630 RepID=A0A1F4VGN2_UNCKA|nr:MAG: tryptophan--tRNA ligase [candidate division WWE3 bacterium RIFCSPLOWO2_12_FULL_36_10]
MYLMYNAHMQNKKRILTGDNTTGKLHLGHYVGSLENRVKLQDEYDTFIIAADMHALAYPKYVFNTDVVSDSILQVTIDNLAVGLDPKKVTFFNESAIPEIYELAIIFSMLVSHSRALRNPTLKEEIKDKGLGDNYSLGFINFPVLMAADILAVKSDLVPVGEDQLPHMELTNEIVRKFNSNYGEVLKEPKPLIGKIARLVGTDGNAKMSKSLNNAIFLGDDEKTVKEKVMSMYTDPKRIHATDPGTVEGNPVFIYHDAFNKNSAEVNDLKDRYRLGKVGDTEVKEKLFSVINEFLAPIREKRVYYENHLHEVRDILSSGVKKTREEAVKTLDEVRSKMKLSAF